MKSKNEDEKTPEYSHAVLLAALTLRKSSNVLGRSSGGTLMQYSRRPKDNLQHVRASTLARGDWKPKNLATGTPAGEGIHGKVTTPTCQNQLFEKVLMPPLTLGQQNIVSSNHSASNSIENHRFVIHLSLFVCAMCTIPAFVPEIPKLVIRGQSGPLVRAHCAETKRGEARRKTEEQNIELSYCPPCSACAARP